MKHSNQKQLEFVSAVGVNEDVWRGIYDGYQDPVLVAYTGMTQTACGTGQAMGPFYCPLDQKMYLDLGFLEDLEKSLGARGFARAYVIDTRLATMCKP